MAEHIQTKNGDRFALIMEIHVPVVARPKLARIISFLFAKADQVQSKISSHFVHHATEQSIPTALTIAMTTPCIWTEFHYDERFSRSKA
jgi:hypothetical protein